MSACGAHVVRSTRDLYAGIDLITGSGCTRWMSVQHLHQHLHHTRHTPYHAVPTCLYGLGMATYLYRVWTHVFNAVGQMTLLNAVGMCGHVWACVGMCGHCCAEWYVWMYARERCEMAVGQGCAIVRWGAVWSVVGERQTSGPAPCRSHRACRNLSTCSCASTVTQRMVMWV